MRFLFLFLLFSLSLNATHIIGGNFKVDQIGRNEFELNLTIFRDCGVGDPDDPNDDPVNLQQSITIRIYNPSNDSLLQSFSINRGEGGTIPLGDKCYTPANLCVEQYLFSQTINLDDNQSGYIIAAQSCCRNFNISNLLDPGATGITWSVVVPDPAIINQNSSPDLGPYPEEGFLCVHQLRTIDLSATDPDLDSLAYELVTPFTAPRQNFANPDPYTPPPFSLATWAPGFSTNNAIPGTPSLSLDPITGILTCEASQLGLYAFAYKVVEYRNGVQIGEVQRDLQLEVLSCAQAYPPIIFEPDADEISVSIEGELCFSIGVVDSNITDTLLLTTVLSEGFQGLSIPPNSLSTRGIGNTGGTICWTPGCEGASLAGKELKILIAVSSLGCEGESTTEREITINVEDPPQTLSQSLPNIFTPNGDGINDVFTVHENLGAEHPCMTGIELKVFNRWGVLIFESSASVPHWDGNYQGAPLSEGVYFYTVLGFFGGQAFEFRNFVTLQR